MAAGGRIDQLRGDAQPIAGAADTAFERVADAKVATDLADIHRAALVGESRIAGDHEQRADARQCRRDVLDQAIDKIYLLRIAAHVLEWQHHERKVCPAAPDRPRSSAGRRIAMWRQHLLPIDSRAWAPS